MPPRKDPRVDAYIEAAAPFARPVLKHLRRCVHEGCPAVEETLKWSMPTFMLGGRILAHMASFKSHAIFGFWSGEQLFAHGLKPPEEDAMGHFGRIGGMDDLPAKAEIVRLVRAAAKVRAEGADAPSKSRTPRKPAPAVPPDLKAALGKNKKARETFAAFSPSHQREYIEWITEAKRDETRLRRLEQAIAWMAEGKPRNWKYMKR